MTAKEFLCQYLNASEEINAKLDQIYRLRELSTKTTQILTHDRVKNTPIQDKTCNIISKIVDLECEIEDDIDRLTHIKLQAEEVIKNVQNPKQRAVLVRRYINGQTWERISSDMNYDYRWVLRLHQKALKEVQLTIESPCFLMIGSN